MAEAQPAPPAVTADHGAWTTRRGLRVDADEEVHHVDREDPPDDDAEEVCVRVERALERTGEGAARIERIEEPRVGEGEEDEVSPEGHPEGCAGEWPRLSGGGDEAGADGLDDPNGGAIAPAPGMEEEHAAQHHHLAEESQADVGGDEREAPDDEESAQEARGGDEHE